MATEHACMNTTTWMHQAVNEMCSLELETSELEPAAHRLVEVLVKATVPAVRAGMVKKSQKTSEF